MAIQNVQYRFIQNVGDYFPSGFFGEDFFKSIQTAAGKDANALKELSKPFAALRQEYDKWKNYIVNTQPRTRDAISHTHAFHTRLLTVLGYDTAGAYAEWCPVDREAGAVVPVRHILRRGGQPKLFIMEMQHMVKMGDSEPEGLFAQRYNTAEGEDGTSAQRYRASQWDRVFTLPEGFKISPAVISKAIDAIFLLPESDRPHYVLLLAGNEIFLFDADKWSRGAYLEFSLDELFYQAQTRQFQNYYALFALLTGKASLAPDTDKPLMDTINEEGYRNAFAVTQDLRDGVIMAIETLANEALHYMREVAHRPFGKYNGVGPVDDPSSYVETDDAFEDEVRDDCLTMVYRLLFVFFAESRPELNILPINDEVYQRGYSLEMLRDMEMTRLNAQNEGGYFFDDTIRGLFRLLFRGFNTEVAKGANKSFRVMRIDSPLFDDANLHHLRDVRIRNSRWQQIIRSLSLSQKSKGGRGRISYANLGINQLGSVYESLLAYRGFYADQDYVEVCNAEKPDEGTFLVPYDRLDDFQAREIVRDDEGRPRILARGTFVYRLSGRDRKKSASYYTPEVLTRSTVRFTLKPILDEVRAGKRKATELLDLKILEPAMGAAAFQNEVINQIAEAYLAERQRELTERFPGSENSRIRPDDYRRELQKVKSYIATHNVYGVDLNRTAIELGKLSLWLNVIHEEMETPFFSNRLAQGNAVVGAWLRTYRRDEVVGVPAPGRKDKLTAREWWTGAPRRVSFSKKGPRRTVNEVYHFLLPDKNMLAVRTIGDLKKADNAETAAANKTLLKAMADKIADWTRPVTTADFNRLVRLSAKIDVRLREYFTFQQSLDRLTQSKVALWGVAGQVDLPMNNYAEKERLNDTRYRHDNAYFRLKAIMDYWTALYFWDLRDAPSLPTREDFWADIEAMLDVPDADIDAHTAQALARQAEARQTDAEQQADADTDALSEIKTLSKQEILGNVMGNHRSFFDDSHRFATAGALAARYHFFHPMLEFLEVFFLRGGFDITVGNPPWVKLSFAEQDVIADRFPEVVIRPTSAPEVRKKIQEFLADAELKALFESERQEQACSAAFLNATANYPLLVGQQTNLYKCVLTNALDLASPENGYVGILCPDGCYDDPAGQPMRRELYRRLRYHFQYQNEFSLFSEVDHHTKYGSQILGPARAEIDFLSINNLFHPQTVEDCFVHHGLGVCGGIKDASGHWNVSGHKERIVRFTAREIALLSKTFEDGTTTDCAKLVSIHAQPLLDVLEKISDFPTHLNEKETIITMCHNETIQVNDGTMRPELSVPAPGSCDAILSGPHFYVGNPCYKNPRNPCVVNSDYDTLNLTTLPADFTPRVKYVPALPKEKYLALPAFRGFLKGQDSEGKPVFDNWLDYYKVGFREMVGPSAERTLICAVLPRKTAHIHTVVSAAFRSGDDCVELQAICSSVVLDFYMKTIAAQHVAPSRMEAFPIGVAEQYRSALYVRTLLLNCLTESYADLWASCWREEFRRETWSVEDPRLKDFGGLSATWSRETPLRGYFARRMALVETDVLVAMALGLTLQDLEMIYRIQFPVLQQNEDDTWYDARGQVVFTASKGLGGVGLDRKEWEQARGEQTDSLTFAGAKATFSHTIDPAKSQMYGGQEETFEAPFTRCDRILDYRRAWAHFEKTLKEK